MPGIQAITFDVGGTLIEPWPSVGEVYASVAAQYGFSVSAEKLNEQFRPAWGRRRDFRHRRSDWAKLVAETFGGLVPGGASDRFFDALYERFGLPDVWHVFDDVRPTLHGLRERGLKLGIISNWDERLRPLLEQLNLAACFDALVISHEVGHLKPAATIFAETARKLAVQPAAVVHVGDSMTEDIEGATAAGMRALWLTRGKRLPGTISSLAEVSRII
jgi:putative hydrolase of the HAD superfamily